MRHQSELEGQKRIKVLLVDDHPLVRERVAELIQKERDFEICGEAGAADQVFGAITKSGPDILLLDLNLKGLIALDLIRDIKARYPSLRVVVLSMYDEAFFAEKVLRAGAQGYVTKDAPSNTVIDAIRKVLSNQMYISDGMARRFSEMYVHGKKNISTDLEGKLSDRELEVFELMGHGLGSRRIAEKLHIGIRTVETHSSRMRVKLQVESSTELLMRAVEWVQFGQPK